MERIRVAQIGIGHDHASGVFETLQLMQDEVEIVGYCIPDDDRTFVETRIKYYAGFPQLSLEEILNDPTIRAVTVETEDHLLTKYTQFALDAGKHVHMDKPGGTDQCAFERMTKTAEEKGLALSLGYMYRFNPALLELFAARHEMRTVVGGNRIQYGGRTYEIGPTARKRVWLVIRPDVLRVVEEDPLEHPERWPRKLGSFRL